MRNLIWKIYSDILGIKDLSKKVQFFHLIWFIWKGQFNGFDIQFFPFVPGEYPAMSSVFVDERDTFLAYSLRQASEAPFQDGCGHSDPPVVVGVVGIGHVKGKFNKF